MSVRFVLFMAIGLVGAAGCHNHPSEEASEPVSVVPRLELVSVSPTTVRQLQDSIVFVVRYTDGDGDLGFESADSMSLELTDNRFPLQFYYHVPPLAPAGASVVITGLLPVVLDNTVLQNADAPSENATFNVRLKDRAGRWSNTITTPTVTVVP